MKTLNERLSYVIENSVFNVTEVAEKINIDRATIHRWTNGETKRITNKNLVALANLLHVNLDWLQFGRGEIYVPATVALEQIRQRAARLKDKAVTDADLDELIQLQEQIQRQIAEIAKNRNS